MAQSRTSWDRVKRRWNIHDVHTGAIIGWVQNTGRRRWAATTWAFDLVATNADCKQQAIRMLLNKVEVRYF